MLVAGQLELCIPLLELSVRDESIWRLNGNVYVQNETSANFFWRKDKKDFLRATAKKLSNHISQ